jgi:23S rRNA (cytosine1962-C5)-methyltransferase
MTHPAIAPDPLVMRTTAWRDYALLDSGGGRKLERYGPYRVIRPEPQCLWRPALPAAEWDKADAVFDPTDEEDAGRWRFPGKKPPEAWTMGWGDQVRFQGRLTSFRHLAVFPEHAANWAWLSERLAGATSETKTLNLFGYTGVASLAMAAAGASVTHIDASKKSVGWARENAQLSGLESHPIRWICEDSRTFVRREQRRGSLYQGIVLDPPKYGRGPGGEVWRLYEDLPELITGCGQLLAPDARFLLLNAYSERLSGLALASLMAQALEGRGGVIDWGELALIEGDGAKGGERGVGLSFFARWRAS